MFRALWHRIKSAYEDKWVVRKIEIAKGDFLPQKIPARNLVLVRDGEEDWSVGFVCPCGCTRTIELLLISDANPHWRLTRNQKGQPTLSPSIWLNEGCRSHFWVRDGKIVWCK